MSDKQQLYLVSHSHWDRAWYLSFQQFRFRLVQVIDRLLDLLESDPVYKSFTLDGQTVLLEDYLEIRPENKSRIQQLIRDERLIIGPWYILPDLFLVSGESVIRNFQYARKISKDLGELSNVGYIPDPFGHWAQLPQVLSQLGYNSFVFMRGMPLEEAERLKLYFTWRAPDGSTTDAIYLKEGYFNASALGYPQIIGRYEASTPKSELAQKQISETIANLNNTQELPVQLLLNGMDHMPEQKEIPELLRELNKSQNPKIKHTSLDDFITTLTTKQRPTEEFSGDLLGNAHHPILSSVFSTRMYLKHQNHRSQQMLERYAEPIGFLRKQISGEPSDQSMLDYAWKELLKNHPHDDICGCSVDQVHRDNEQRFAAVEDIGDVLITETLEQIALSGTAKNGKQDKTHTPVFVFNPHPFSVIQTISTTIFFPNPDGEFGDSPADNQIELTDPAGNSIPAFVKQSSAPEVSRNYLGNIWGRLYEIEFQAEIEGLSHQIYQATLTDTPREESDLKNPDRHAIQNLSYELTEKNQYLTLRIKNSHIEIKHPFWFEFEQDEGDTYSFGPLKNGEIYTSELHSFSVASDNNATAVFKLSIPSSIEDKTNTELYINADIHLENEQILLNLSYTNTIKDGRLRLISKTGFLQDTLITDGHFRLAERTQVQAETPETNSERYEKYPGEFNYQTLHQGDGSVILGTEYHHWTAHRGNPEIEIVERDGSGCLATTLHRSVQKLSVGNGRIRRVQAGPSVDTPEAQCLRDFEQHFAFGYENISVPEIIQSIKTFSHPLYVKEIPRLIDAPQQGSVPTEKSWLNIDNPNILLSSFRINKDGHTVIRIYNISDEDEDVQLSINWPAAKWCTSNLWDEWNAESEQTLKNETISLLVRHHAIETIIVA
jgi:mannosylglycerate hydrolase